MVRAAKVIVKEICFVSIWKARRSIGIATIKD
jgi:hypothetical protein